MRESDERSGWDQERKKSARLFALARNKALSVCLSYILASVFLRAEFRADRSNKCVMRVKTEAVPAVPDQCNQIINRENTGSVCNAFRLQP